MSIGVALSSSVRWCSLCGLRIPHRIASDKHPLFGTIDHVIPRSRGGKNNFRNRKPAHLLCNQLKGNSLYLCKPFVEELQRQVAEKLRDVGLKQNGRMLMEARDRIAFDSLPGMKSGDIRKLERAMAFSLAMARWEDDGGPSL